MSFVDVEHSVARAVLREGEDLFRGLHRLPDLDLSGGDHAGRVGTKLGEGEAVARRSQQGLR